MRNSTSIEDFGLAKTSVYHVSSYPSSIIFDLTVGDGNMAAWDFLVACVYCGKEIGVTLESIDSRKAIKCTACGKASAIGDVFQALYEKEPLVQKAVDTLTSYATSQWSVKADDKDTQNTTETFLTQVQFDNLLKSTATQVLVQGDAFLHTSDQGWQLLPSQQVTIKASSAPKQDWNESVLKDDQFIWTTNEQTKSFDPKEIIHFKNSSFGGHWYRRTPYGESIIQIALTPLHRLAEFRRCPPHIQAEFKKWHDYLDWQARCGLQVPDFVLEKKPLGCDRRVAELMLPSFVYRIGRLQELLSNGFDTALERFAKRNRLRGVPKIHLRELTARKVLINCGFDFSEEQETLRRSAESRIITKEELERMLDEYEP